MGSSRDRWPGWAGIAFVVLFIVGFFTLVLRSAPDPNASTASFTAFVADSAKRHQAVAGMFLLALAALAFLWFVVGLHARLRSAEGEPAQMSRLALASGIVYVVILSVAAATITVAPAGVVFGPTPVPNGDLIRELFQLGFVMLLVFGLIPVALLIAITSALAIKKRALPGWLGPVGFVLAAVQLIAAPIFPAAFALPLWVLLVSIVLLMPSGSVGDSPSSLG
ncbi:MAG TPA: hypothetical protein VF972_08770 [Actinomycetota bacterium]